MDSAFALAPRVADAVENFDDLSFFFFGHSVGALVAFETARELRRRNSRMPSAIFASGKRAPHVPLDQHLHALPDDQLLEALRLYNGTPPGVLANAELMEMFLPVLRADFSVGERYVFQGGKPLDVPIVALGGTEDGGVLTEHMEAWQEHTSAEFSYRMFPGDHFFHQGDGEDAVVRFVASTADRLLATEYVGRSKGAQSITA